MLTMNEILNIVPTWTVIKSDTQVAKGPVWVDGVKISCNKDDQTLFYDGVGTTGKLFTHVQPKDFGSECVEMCMLFRDGLYIDVPGSINHLTIVYRTLPE